MKKALIAAAAGMAATLAAAAPAFAQVYAGAGAQVFQADGGSSGDVNLGAILGRVGYKANPFFGLEGEFSIGVQDDDYTVLGTKVNVGLDNEAGVFAVGWLPIPLFGDLFVRGGYANLKVSASAGPFSASDGGSGFAYGAGIQTDLLLFAKLRLEYTHYEPEDGDFDAVGLSALLQF